jgi:SAM-dependent methyltransferase
LYYLNKEYSNAIGIEPGVNASAACKTYNLKIVNGFFEAHDFAEQRFDMIILLHVFEHFYDINIALEKCKNLLKENGYLFIEIPNILKPFMSLDHYFLRYVHLINYSESTISLMLGKHGFSVPFIEAEGSKGAIPMNILVIAKKEQSKNIIDSKLNIDYKSIIKELWLRRLYWNFIGSIQFKFMRFKKAIKTKLINSKSGHILKKILK